MGLVVGFVGAAFTFFVVDRYGDEDPPGEEVYEFLDFAGYCDEAVGGMRPIRISNTSEGWMCGGRPSGIWTTEQVDIDALCIWQYGDAAVPRLDDADDPNGWRCVVQ